MSQCRGAKVYHFAKLIATDGSGRVSPLCAKVPKALNNKTQTWTIRKEAVTCDKCKALLTYTPTPERSTP